MTSSNYPIEAQFPVARTHPNRQAHQWLAKALDDVDWGSDHKYLDWEEAGVDAVMAKLVGQSPGMAIAVLKACVERMPWHRSQPRPAEGLSDHYYVGSVLHGLACRLYSRKLPLTEQDLIDLLNLSKHDCGHGGDVTPPFDLALDYARRHGVSSRLFEAVRTYVAALRAVRAAQVNFMKRRAGLLLVLDDEGNAKSKRCWSQRFRTGLQRLPAEEQAQWRRLVVHMVANDLVTPSKGFRKLADEFVAALGAPLVFSRLADWWPDGAVQQAWPLETGGSHLLKHFVWLLGTVCATEPNLTGPCMALVGRLTDLDWRPVERIQKVMVAATASLAELPPAVSWGALQRLERWSSDHPGGFYGVRVGKIAESIAAYRQLHDLREAASRGGASRAKARDGRRPGRS